MHNKTFLVVLDISVTMDAWECYRKNPKIKHYYELYKQAVPSMNISFVNLGNEEWFDSESSTFIKKIYLTRKNIQTLTVKKFAYGKSTNKTISLQEKNMRKIRTKGNPTKSLFQLKMILIFLIYLAYLICLNFLFGGNGG